MRRVAFATTVSFLLIFGVGHGSAQTALLPSADIPDTNAEVEMKPNGFVIVHYDNDPEHPIGAAPGEGAHHYFTELAGNMKPGEHRRLPTFVTRYSTDDGGTFKLLALVQLGTAVPEPGSRTVARSDPDYACYRSVLKLEVGLHVLNATDWKAVLRCIQAR